jgi:hypothetical protein
VHGSWPRALHPLCGERPADGHGNDGQGPCGAFPIDGIARRRVWGTSGDAPMVRRAPIGHQSRTVAQTCCLAQPAAATGSAFAVAPAAPPRYRGRVFRFAADTGATIGARLRLPKVAGSSVRLLPLKHTRNQSAAGKRGSCGTRPPRCPHADPSAAQGPKVRRLFAGGEWIRTFSSAPMKLHERAAISKFAHRRRGEWGVFEKHACAEQFQAGLTIQAKARWSLDIRLGPTKPVWPVSERPVLYGGTVGSNPSS